MAKYNRREFLEKSLKFAFITGLCSHVSSGCTGLGTARKSLDAVLSSDQYATLTKDWDPVYGPPIQWFSRYGGPGDFQGHIRGDASPGIDYDVQMYTPVVPMMTSYLRQRTRDPSTGSQIH